MNRRALGGGGDGGRCEAVARLRREDAGNRHLAVAEAVAAAAAVVAPDGIPAGAHEMVRCQAAEAGRGFGNRGWASGCFGRRCWSKEGLLV